MKNCNCDKQKIDMAVCGPSGTVLPSETRYITKVIQPSVIKCGNIMLEPWMMSVERTKYVIKWNFDLDGKTITVPEKCVLEFDGGSLRNGTIIGQDTFVNNVGGVDTIFGASVTQEGTWRYSSSSSDPKEGISRETADELYQPKGSYQPAGDYPTTEEVEQMISDIPKDVDDHLDATSVNPVQNKVVTEALNDISAGIANVSLSVSPTAVFVGEQSGIIIGATSNMAASEIKIKRGDTVIGNGSGTTLNASDVITSSNAGNIAYAAEFTIAGRIKTASKNVAAVYPIYYGAGQTYSDATQKASVRTSPAGTYTINVPNTGDHVFFVVPRNMNITKATMSGFDFPLNAPVNIEIGGVAYKYYKDASDVGYTAGSVTIVVI